MKFAIYSRKSKATDKGESIGNQVEMCRNYINANAPGEEHEFLIYEDEGFSGKNTKRPEFLRMMQDAKKKRFQQVVVYRLDRISRNIVDFMTITEKLQSSGIGFISINERFDTTTPMGRAMMQIAAVFAQLERETIAERVQDNMLMLSYTGRWLGGKTPFGFSSKRIFQNKELGIEKSYSRLVPNEDMKIVRLIFERYEAAGSFHAVQVYLHERQLMAQNASRTTDFFIRNLLSNPVYCAADEAARSYFEERGSKVAGEAALWDGRHGIMPYNRHSEKKEGTIQREVKEWVLAVGEHEGTIEGERFVRIQRRIAANKERYNSFTSATNDYALLSGLLYCAKCGKRMYTKPQNKKGRGASAASWFYVCETQKKYTSKACSCRAVMGQRLDDAVLKAFDDAFVPNTDLAAQIEKLRPNGIQKKEAGIEKIRWEKRKQEIDREQHTLYGMMGALMMEKGDGCPEIEVYRQQVFQLTAELLEINEKLKALEAETSKAEDQERVYKTICEIWNGSFGNEFRKEPVPVQRDKIRQVLHRAEWDGEKLHLFLRGAQ